MLTVGQTWVVFPSNLQNFPSLAIFWRRSVGGHHIFLEGDLVGSCIPPVPEPTNRPLPYLLRVQYPSLQYQKCWIPRCGGGASFCYPKSGTLFHGVSAQVNQSVIQFCSIQKSILLCLFKWNMEHVLGCFTCLIWSLLHGAVMGIKGGINTCINLMINQLFNLCNL